MVKVLLASTSTSYDMCGNDTDAQLPWRLGAQYLHNYLGNLVVSILSMHLDDQFRFNARRLRARAKVRYCPKYSNERDAQEVGTYNSSMRNYSNESVHANHNSLGWAW